MYTLEKIVNPPHALQAKFHWNEVKFFHVLHTYSLHKSYTVALWIVAKHLYPWFWIESHFADNSRIPYTPYSFRVKIKIKIELGLGIGLGIRIRVVCKV